MLWADLIYRNRLPLFYGITITGLLLLVAGFLIDAPYLGLVIFGFVGLLLVLLDFKLIFYLLLLFLPLSNEYELFSGIRMYLPTEPLVILLLFLFVPYVIYHQRIFTRSFWKHPLTLILVINVAWIFVTIISSTHPMISLKYFIAKIWYVVVYYFLASFIIRSNKEFNKVFWLLVLPTIGGLIYVLTRHAMTGFLFDTVSSVVRPIYRNHVDYGVWITAILPLLFLGRTWYKRDTLMRLFLNLAIVLNLAAIYFSYTRGAWVALAAIPIFYYIVKIRMVKPVLLISSIVVLIFVGNLFTQNNYLQYAPDYDKTIYHEDFSDHMSATFQMEDMSTVERFYRWIAAVNMFSERPITGFGPGNFVNNYKNYTVSAYETYISDNEEGSSVHNYFLTMLTEQGIPGLLIFVAMIFIILIYFQKVYHETKKTEDKYFIMTISCCFFVLLVNNMFSDLLEADKLGPLFFMCMAILVNWDLKNDQIEEITTETYKSIS